MQYIIVENVYLTFRVHPITTYYNQTTAISTLLMDVTLLKMFVLFYQQLGVHLVKT